MLRRTTFVAFTIALALVATSASAQLPCIIGAYADEDGTESVGIATRDFGSIVASFDVYYVLFTEDFVNAAAWGREVTGFGNSPLIRADYEAFGTFVEDRPEGYRLGIGSCVIGFGGVPIVLLRETWNILDDYTPSGGSGTVQVIENVNEPEPNNIHPVYNTCNDVILPCEAGQLLITRVVPNDSESWGSVKALFK